MELEKMDFELEDELDLDIFNVYKKLTEIDSIPEKEIPATITLAFIRIKNGFIDDIEYRKINVDETKKIKRDYIRSLVDKKYADYCIQQILYYNNGMTHNDVEKWFEHKKPFKGFLLSVANQIEIELKPSLFIFHPVSTLYVLLKPKITKKIKHTKRIIQPVLQVHKSIMKKDDKNTNGSSKTKKVQIKPEHNTTNIY
jgi:hypothetical protein